MLLERDMNIFDNAQAKRSLYTRKVSHMYIIDKSSHADLNNGNWEVFLVLTQVKMAAQS